MPEIAVARQRLELLEPGTRFGKWTVLSFKEAKPGKGGVYECKCDCGTLSDISGTRLRIRATSKCKRCALLEGRQGFVRFNQ